MFNQYSRETMKMGTLFKLTDIAELFVKYGFSSCFFLLLIIQDESFRDT